jgi:protein-disulfide isomerase
VARLTLLTTLVAAAPVLPAGGASSGDRATTAARTTSAAAKQAAGPVAALRGVPQDGLSLGKADAPVTVVEFIDVQCPFCKQFEDGVFPLLLHDYIRTGKVRFEQRTMSFLGPDSVRGAKFLGAAAKQDRQFEAAGLMFRDQGRENSGYLDDAFLRKVGRAIKGFDTERALREMGAPAAQAPLGEANTMAQRYGVTGTPTVLIGTDIRALERVESPSVKDPKAYVAAIEAALGGRGGGAKGGGATPAPAPRTTPTRPEVDPTPGLTA